MTLKVASVLFFVGFQKKECLLGFQFIEECYVYVELIFNRRKIFCELTWNVLSIDRLMTQ